MARPAEPVNPVSQDEPLGALGHVFALVLVGARDEESVHPAVGQFGAQRGEARRTVGGVALFVEGLEWHVHGELPGIKLKT